MRVWALAQAVKLCVSCAGASAGITGPINSRHIHILGATCAQPVPVWSWCTSSKTSTVLYCITGHHWQVRIQNTISQCLPSQRSRLITHSVVLARTGRSQSKPSVGVPIQGYVDTMAYFLTSTVTCSSHCRNIQLLANAGKLVFSESSRSMRAMSLARCSICSMGVHDMSNSNLYDPRNSCGHELHSSGDNIETNVEPGAFL
eukprot:scpid80781/ scgid23403/ 